MKAGLSITERGPGGGRWKGGRQEGEMVCREWEGNGGVGKVYRIHTWFVEGKTIDKIPHRKSCLI